MAWEYGFFNSVNGDRVYNAQQMSSIFEGLITDGVYESVGNKLAVQSNSGMTIQIASGRGWFNKHWVSNNTPELITLEASDVTLNRYAAICIRVDDSDGVRSAVPYVKYGSYATNPTKPAMTRGEVVNEYCLAYVYIGAGVSEITQANIEDTRANRELCGWVTGLIEQLNSTTLFSQWEAIFTEWFEGLTDLINENTEVMLVDAMPTNLELTIPVSNWVDKTATVELIGMTATKTVICETEANIKLTGQDTNTLIFTADTVPTAEVTVKVVYMGV